MRGTEDCPLERLRRGEGSVNDVCRRMRATKQGDDNQELGLHADLMDDGRARNSPHLDAVAGRFTSYRTATMPLRYASTSSRCRATSRSSPSKKAMPSPITTGTME